MPTNEQHVFLEFFASGMKLSQARAMPTYL